MKDTLQTTAPIDYNYERSRFRFLLHSQSRWTVLLILSHLVSLASAALLWIAASVPALDRVWVAIGGDAFIISLLATCLCLLHSNVTRREIRAEIKGIKSYSFEDKGI